MADCEYNRGDIVLVFSTDDSNWHKAKIVDCKIADSEVSYLIHYHGWNAGWDEWICDTLRIVHGSKDKEQCKRMLEEKRKKTQNKPETVKETEPAVTQRGNVKLLTLPRQIRECLLSQHRLIGLSQSSLISLPKPSNVCIKNVAAQFVKFQSDKIEKMNKLNPLEEKLYLKRVIDSIIYHFNVCIDYLLNENERKQKNKLQHKAVMDWSVVYGVEHLFRLFYHLPKIYANIKQMSVLQAAKISNYVSLFIGFLANNVQKYVISDFY